MRILAALVHGLRALLLRPTFHGALESPRNDAAVGSSLTVAGWALSTEAPIERIEAWLDDASAGRLHLGPVAHGLPRPDVDRAFPWRDVRGAGFAARFALDPEVLGPRTLVVRVVDRLGHERDYRRAVTLTGNLAFVAWRSRHGIRAAAASEPAAEAFPAVVTGETTPRVSICVPTFNGAAHLADALASASAQSFDDVEILVVDDASTDGTLDVAEQAARRDRRVRLHRGERRAGLAGNWNRAVALARGEWIKFLFQDDLLDPRCVERMLSVADDVGLVVCRRTGRFEPGVARDLADGWARHAATHNLARMFPGEARIDADRFAERLLGEPTTNWIGEPTATLVRRDTFVRLGGFHPGLDHLVDWEHLSRVALHTGCAWIDDALATFRVHNDSATARSRDAHRFMIEVLDPLVVLHEHATAPVYAPLRAAAGRQAPPLDLGERLHDAVVEAHRRYAKVGKRAGARDDWEAALRRYPWLAEP